VIEIYPLSCFGVNVVNYLLKLLIASLCSSFFLANAADTYAEHPFSATSIWNTPIGTGATYQAKSGLESTMISNQNAGGNSKAYPWIGSEAFGIYQATESDPVAVWNYSSRAGTLPWPFNESYTRQIKINTPSNIKFLGGTDQHAVIIMPDKEHALEMWKGSYNATTKQYSADYLIYTDLTGSGISSLDGISEGIRGFGGSLVGGLVRKAELDNFQINHAIAMALSQTQQKAGLTMYDQKVWPASFTDNGGANNYSGAIPVGALFAIPRTTSISSMGLLTNEGKALARALKYYGGYNVETATNTTVLAYLEAGCTSTQVSNLQSDKRTILKHLVMVTNNSETSVGGSGERLVDVVSSLD
jgi:hypothetical protein